MKREEWWAVLILLVAAGLRFFHLGARSLWFDEALSVLIGRLTLQQVLTGAAGSSHPPAYYLLLHIWERMGEGEWFLRYPSVFASLLAVVLTYRMGCLMFSRRVGVLGALGMALSPFQVYYAQEARMYALAIALTLGLTWCFVQGVRHPRSVAAWAGYALLSVLGLYTHYFVAWVLLAFHLWLLICRPRRIPWLSLLFADVLIGLVFLPQVVQFSSQTKDYLTGVTSWQIRPSPLSSLVTLEYLLFGHAAPARWWWGVRVAVVLLLTAFVTLEWTHRQNRVWRRWVGLLSLAVVLPLFLVVGISWLFQPIYLERSFAMIAPYLVLFLAQGVAAAPSRFSPVRWIGLVLVGFLVVGLVASLVQPDIAKPPVREAMAVVAEGFREGDLCLHLDETYLSSLVYGSGLSPALLDVGQRIWMRPSTYQTLGGRAITPDEALVAEGRLWLVVAGRSRQPWEGFLEQIERERRQDGEWEWENLALYRYE